MDIHTLHIAHIVLLAVYTLLTMVNARMHRNVAGIGWFVGYGLCVWLGALFIGLRGVIPNFLSIFGGLMVVSIGYALLHRSMTEYFGCSTRYQRAQIGFICVLALGVLYLGVIHPSTRYRLMLLSVVLVGQQGLTAAFVARHTPAYMRAAGGAMAAVLALLTLSNLFRLASLFFQDAPADYLQGGTVLAWSVLNNSVLQGGVIIAYVWMTAAHLRHDLETLAMTDPLTGLLNRRAIEMAAKRVIAASERNVKTVSAILIDLDGFKEINDTHGHACGDSALVAVARCIQGEIRQNDYAARLGGDEFVVLLPETALETAVAVAGRLRDAFSKMALLHGGERVPVKASFGVAQLVDPMHDWDALVSRCDHALYKVKGLGGNLVTA